MIDNILEDLFIRWSDASKCGYCWKLVRTFNDHYNAKGTTNIYTPISDDKCCVHAFLEGLTISNSKSIDNKYGTTKLDYCDYKLHFKILKQGDFEKPKADETGCEDNNYDNVIRPLIECLDCEFETDVCSLLDGETGIVFGESVKPYFSYGDHNWVGLDYYVTIRIYK